MRRQINDQDEEKGESSEEKRRGFAYDSAWDLPSSTLSEKLFVISVFSYVALQLALRGSFLLKSIGHILVSYS